jgi:hypothetical protein
MPQSVQLASALVAISSAGHSRDVGKFSLCGVPHLHRVDVTADQILQVDGQRFAIGLETASCRPNALCDVEYDAGKSVLVDPDLLVVWDFAKPAGGGAYVSETLSSCCMAR